MCVFTWLHGYNMLPTHFVLLVFCKICPRYKWNPRLRRRSSWSEALVENRPRSLHKPLQIKIRDSKIVANFAYLYIYIFIYFYLFFLKSLSRCPLLIFLLGGVYFMWQDISIPLDRAMRKWRSTVTFQVTSASQPSEDRSPLERQKPGDFKTSNSDSHID